ncbi:ABC transporter ATP-binding protein [Roseivirga sp. BDSF3-8]|uniref:ABC transporter ATP-binding protein n=1 Tax=Roseivirga sp. BDSF3-8 TaxID=3241598 RepID=UPI0035322864
MLKVDRLTKIYSSGSHDVTVLQDVSFEVPSGSTFSIVGPSGSGKTTLLGLCAGLDSASSGSVTLNGIALQDLSEDQRASVRNEHVGFIFQNFQLLPTLTALENVMVPMELSGQTKAAGYARELLEKVGLGERVDHYPAQLSGGEQQRVALARAFANKPAILFADEPTGNLDEETGELVETMLFDLNRETGTTLVLVTHDLELARRTHHIVRLKGGKLIESLQGQFQPTITTDI